MKKVLFALITMFVLASCKNEANKDVESTDSPVIETVEVETIEVETTAVDTVVVE